MTFVFHKFLWFWGILVKQFVNCPSAEICLSSNPSHHPHMAKLKYKWGFWRRNTEAESFPHTTTRLHLSEEGIIGQVCSYKWRALWVLGTELGFSERETSVLNYWNIFPAWFLFDIFTYSPISLHLKAWNSPALATGSFTTCSQCPFETPELLIVVYSCFSISL